MTRISATSASARRLIERLAPMFLAHGSVNALSQSLSDALSSQRGKPVQIYPNRLHALLSGDAGVMVNGATFMQIEKAVEAAHLRSVNDARFDGGRERTEALILALWRDEQASFSPETIAERLGLPLGVVGYVLDKHRAGVKPAARTALPAAAAPRPGDAPDWSFQMVAYERCLAALQERPDMKIGLVCPTGAGKTRMGLRIALGYLDQRDDQETVVLWVTHQKNLHEQASEELKLMLIEGDAGLPVDAPELLARRIRFIMLSELAGYLGQPCPPAMVIVDEAHHAAASSYRSIFETDYSLNGLFLTATPNRTDGLPLGIDRIAYNITYRQLERSGVILRPEFVRFPVANFEWDDRRQVERLADHLIEKSRHQYVKTIVLADQVKQVHAFYAVLRERLRREPGHPLHADDIGFVHSDGNSLHATTKEFLLAFRAKSTGILVATRILLEGYNDPSVNTVVITYATKSLITLIQAMGRCVRYAPGKKKAFVVQASNPDLAYYFDQRWLYQEITDTLRPRLEDVAYRSADDLEARVAALLEAHRVDRRTRDALLAAVRRLTPGSRCRVLFYGKYLGRDKDFAAQSEWGAVLETDANSEAFRTLFNTYCERGARIGDSSDFLREMGRRFGFAENRAPGSAWSRYKEMLTSMSFAAEELGRSEREAPSFAQEGRPYRPGGATTWLKYVTFEHRPDVPDALTHFLADCWNADALTTAYVQAPQAVGLAFKLPLPLGGAEGHFVAAPRAAGFRRQLADLRAELGGVPHGDRVAAYEAFLSRLTDTCGLPLATVRRLEHLLCEGAEQRLLDLG